MVRCVAFFAAIAAVLSGAQAWSEPLKVVSEVVPPNSGSVQFVVHSDRIGRDFQVTVSGPAATTFLPGQKLPAIYALDAGYSVAGPEGQFLSNMYAMSPAAVVSIGYLPGQWSFRGVDLAHKPWKPEGLPSTGGGGAAFEAFLLEDLKPWLEAKYPIDPARSILVGHSLGGLFAANVFADRPDAFAGYVMASVSVWAQPDVVPRVAAAAARAKGERVYLSVAEFDDGGNGTRMHEGFDAMAGALVRRPGVELKTQIYPGENHSSYYARLLLDSFPYMLPGAWLKTTSTLPMTAEALARYAGTYRMPDGREIAFRASLQGQLTAQVTGSEVVALLANGRDRFYAPTSDIDVVFDTTGANLSGGGAKLRIEKAP